LFAVLGYLGFGFMVCMFCLGGICICFGLVCLREWVCNSVGLTVFIYFGFYFICVYVGLLSACSV